MISDKLRKSIEERVGESKTGRVIIPYDIKIRYSKETGITDEFDRTTNILNIAGYE